MSTSFEEELQKNLEMGKTKIITLPPLSFKQELTADYCTQCEGEIYQREDYYRIDGQTVCTDCLPRFAEHYFGLCRMMGGNSQPK